MNDDFDAILLSQELKVIKYNIDNVSQFKNLATIKKILNNIHFADIVSDFQIAENLGDVCKDRYSDEPEIYKNISLSYIVEPKKSGAFYGYLYIKKDKDENETQCSKEIPFNSYARFIIDLVSQKIIYSSDLKRFALRDKSKYLIIDENNFNDIYHTPKNSNLYIDDFLEVMLEVFRNHIKQRHNYVLHQYVISGKDWRFDCKSLELIDTPPNELELFFDYYEVSKESLNIEFANNMLNQIANDTESLNNLKLVHSYILMRKLRMIPAEKWFLFKDFGRTGKGLIT